MRQNTVLRHHFSAQIVVGHDGLIGETLRNGAIELFRACPCAFLRKREEIKLRELSAGRIIERKGEILTSSICSSDEQMSGIRRPESGESRKGSEHSSECSRAYGIEKDKPCCPAGWRCLKRDLIAAYPLNLRIKDGGCEYLFAVFSGRI